MKDFVKFMVSPVGRGVRIVAGLILIAVGLFAYPVINWIWVIIGIVPLSAGVFDFCLLAPLFGYSFSGPQTRAKVNTPSA